MTSRIAEHRPRRTLRRLAGLALAATALTGASACGSEGGAGGGSGTASGEPVKLGFVAARSGAVAFAGKSFAQGAELAVKDLNGKDYLGGGRKLELVEKEGAENASRAVGQVRQLAADRDVSAVFGGILSPTAGAISPLAKSSKLPYVIYGATDEGLAEPPYVFRSNPLPQPANAQLGRDVAQRAKPSSVAYVVTQDNSGMQSQLQAFKRSFSAAGVRDLGTTDVLAAQTDLGGPAAQVIGRDPDAIVVSTIQPNLMGLITELRRRGYDGLIVGNETIASPGSFKAVGKPMAGVPFPVYFTEGTAPPAGKAFAEGFRKAYGAEADSYAAQGYIAVYTIATAAKSVEGDVDRESLAAALGRLKEMRGTIYGDVTFDGGQLRATGAITDVAWREDGTIAPWEPDATR